MNDIQYFSHIFLILKHMCRANFYIFRWGILQFSRMNLSHLKRGKEAEYAIGPLLP
jgi:hypothetical protein